MKSFFEFINETTYGNGPEYHSQDLKINKDLTFYIMILDSDREKRKQLIEEFKKYFVLDIFTQKYILNSSIIRVKIYKNYADSVTVRFHRFGAAGGGIKHNIYIDKFLEIKLENIEKYFEIEDNIKKYNL